MFERSFEWLISIEEVQTCIPAQKLSVSTSEGTAVSDEQKGKD